MTKVKYLLPNFWKRISLYVNVKKRFDCLTIIFNLKIENENDHPTVETSLFFNINFYSEIYLLPICQILQNFTERNARIFIVSFAFCARVDVMKYPKPMAFSFECVQIT